MNEVDRLSISGPLAASPIRDQRQRQSAGDQRPAEPPLHGRPQPEADADPVPSQSIIDEFA